MRSCHALMGSGSCGGNVGEREREREGAGMEGPMRCNREPAELTSMISWRDCRRFLRERSNWLLCRSACMQHCLVPHLPDVHPPHSTLFIAPLTAPTIQQT
jgi:hypothetical protein